MKDLKIKYKNENGEVISREYNTIMDFMDEMESDSVDIPMLDYTDVYAIFFDKHEKYFGTIKDLLEHCKNITK